MQIIKKTTNTVDVTKEHRPLMEKVFNESYVHACESAARGHQTSATRKLILQLADNAAHFNVRYKDALHKMKSNESQFTDDDMAIVHELLVYSTIEMMRALHLKNTKSYQETGLEPVPLKAVSVENTPEAFYYALSNFAVSGAKSGRTYSACGLAISLGGESDYSENNLQSAFGGKDESVAEKLSREQQSWHGGRIKKGTCVNCHKETEVGVKNWCKKCIKC